MFFIFSLNTPPGTKLLLQGPLTTVHGIILLKPANIGQILVGKVANLVEKWELNKVFLVLILNAAVI